MSKKRKARNCMASNQSKQALYRAADAYRLASQSQDPDELRRASGELLAAAKAWWQSAKERNENRGFSPRKRPKFSIRPRRVSRSGQLTAKQYDYALTFWASKYAWDIEYRYREEATEAARQLLTTGRATIRVITS